MTAKNNKQIWREEKEKMHTRFILVHSIQELHPVLNQTIEYFTMQPITDYTHTTQRGDFESHKAYSPSLHTTNTSSQNHTDFIGFYNILSKSNMNNYKNLNRDRKHLESQYTRTLLISSLNHSKAQKQSC